MGLDLPALSVLDGGSIRTAATSTPAGGYKQRAVLVSLALRRDRVVPLALLVDTAWPEEPPAKASTSVHTYISRLRRLLQPVGVAIERRQDGYVLAVPPERLDVASLRARTRSGQAALADGRPADAVSDLAAALEMWHDPPLGDLATHPALSGSVDALVELWRAAIEGIAAAQLRTGEHLDVIARLTPLAAAHPTWEAVHGDLMLALYRAGRQADALALYRSSRRRLVEATGLEPGPSLQRLHARMLAQHPVLDLGSTTGPLLEGNLPTPLTGLVGRDADVRAVSEALTRSRLVTLVGPAGVGKTRLATEVARVAAGSLTGGAWTIDLATLDDPEGLPRAVAEALGISEPPDVPLLKVLIARLREQPRLLLLDNCEHLVADCAALAKDLLSACPDLRLLLTSRERLAVVGETVLPVAPLTLDPVGEGVMSPAVQLFVDRARQADPHLDLEADGAHDILTDICRRLDGIPLAIELAAVQVRGLGLHGLLQQLLTAESILTAPARAGTPHRTLLDALDRSHQLLPTIEQRLFRRLSAFAGPFAAEAASALVPLDEPPVAVDEVLASLVDRSMIQPVDAADGRRYRLLETMRAYAAHRAREAGEDDLGRRRHAAYHLQALQRADAALHGPDQGRALAQLLTIQPELRSALAWAMDGGPATLDQTEGLLTGLGWFWHITSRGVEAMEWVERWRLRADAPAVPGPQLTESYARFLIGDLAASADTGQTAATGFRERDQAALAAQAFGQAGTAAMLLGDRDRAAVLLEEAIELGRRHDVGWVVAGAMVSLGRVGFEDGRRGHGREMVADALALAQQHRQRYEAGLALYCAARLAIADGDPATGRAHLRTLLGGQLRAGQGRTLIVVQAVAALSAGAGRAAEGARLLGAIDRAGSSFGYDPAGIDPRWTADGEEAIGSALDPESLVRERAVGAALPWTEVVSLTRALLDA